MAHSLLTRLLTASLTTAALLVAGCAVPAVKPAVEASFALSIPDGLELLAAPQTHQWSTGLITGEAIQRRGEEVRNARAERRIQSVTANWDRAMTAFGVAGVTGRISSAPSYHYYTKVCYWITDDGWLLSYNTLTNATNAVQVSTSDTFPNTAITLSNYGTRAYLVSAEGNFFSIDTADGSVIDSVVSMGGTNANVTHGAAPFIDSLASRSNGTMDTVYAVTATGVLNRFICTQASTTLAQSYTLPVVNGTHTELFKSGPVVLGGKAVVTSWRRHNTTPYNHANDEGAIYYYDTNAKTPVTTLTAGALAIPRIVTTSPIWAPAAVDVDNALNPTYAFFPAGASAMMVDLATGSTAQSVPLVVDSNATANGTLSSYAYSTTGTTTVTKYAKNLGAGILYQTGAVGTTNMYAARQMSSSNTNQLYGYMKFNIADTDLTSGNVLKVVTNANLLLNCNASSNAAGTYAPASPRVFRVHNQLASGTGTAWTTANLAFATRPPHMDGTAFDQTTATLTAKSSWELPRTGSAIFINGVDYTWPAKGKIGVPGDYSLGMVHTQLYETTSLFGGITSVPTPKFDGGNAAADSPRLALTVSQAGFASPTLSAPVSIDAINKQIFVANTNALFKVSYATTLNTWPDRAANFGDDDKTTFALTNLGANASASPTHTAGTRFVENPCAPLFDGRYVYIQDNHPGLLRSSVSRFTPNGDGVAPTLSASLVLSDAGADARSAPPYMSFDYESNRLMLATYSPSAALGRAWVVNRF